MAKDNRPALLAIALLVSLAAPAEAKPRKPASADPAGGDLAACLKVAEATPDAAVEKALVWQDRGGGDPARLCHAMALYHRGQFDAAGTRLEDLVGTMGKDDPKAAATLLSHAGWARLRAGQAERAERLYGEALTRQPDDVDLHIDRAFARADQEKYWDAVADLDWAIRKAPKRADAYVYRAGAYRHLGNLDAAQRDVAQALELKPNDSDALLLRGNLRALKGDAKGAREDWKQVMRLDPDTTNAHNAETNLARLQAQEKTR